MTTLNLYLPGRKKHLSMGALFLAKIVKVLLIHCTHRWVRTGDEVKIGQDGEVVVLDRLKAGKFLVHCICQLNDSCRKS
jgi:hypothetical protein